MRKNLLFISKRRRIIKFLLEKGVPPIGISKRLKKIKDGRYAASYSVVKHDIQEIIKKRENYEKIYNPHYFDVWQRKRVELVDQLDVLIKKAKTNNQFRTAGELITKKARLLGVDKFIAPKEKKKDEIEEKYKHKTQEEINNVLFQEFKDLAATLTRMVKEKKLNNIIRLTIRIVRLEEKDKKVKYILSRFGEEKKLYEEQKEFKRYNKG